jgi:hypothetical protein
MSYVVRMPIRWGAQWRTREFTHLMCQERIPVLFRTRADARKWIENNFGYIRTREDLKIAPHWWKMPIAVKVRVEISE